MVQIIRAKILGTDGNILKKFLNKNYIQKYLTPEEIDFIEKLPPKDWVGKLEMLRDFKEEPIEKKQTETTGYDPLYVYDNIFFYNAQDFARYIYCKENNVNAIDWVRKNKGEKFMRQYKKKTDKDFKRRILLINTLDDIPLKVYEKRNDNIKIKLYCSKCGRADFQSPKTVLHFNNLLCKSCRRKLLAKQKGRKNEQHNN